MIFMTIAPLLELDGLLLRGKAMFSRLSGCADQLPYRHSEEQNEEHGNCEVGEPDDADVNQAEESE
jgi:hypothetical protein